MSWTRNTGLAVVLVLSASQTPCLGQVELYVPHVIAGGGRTGNRITRLVTRFVILNNTDDPVQVDIELTTDTGESFDAFVLSSIHPNFGNRIRPTIGARESAYYETGVFGPLASGWARIRATGSISVQVNLSRLVLGPTDTSFRVVSRASLQPEEPRPAFSTLRRFDLGTAYPEQDEVGLALFNPSPTETAEVSLVRSDELGNVIGEQTVTIPPLGKITRLLATELFPGDGPGSGADPVSITSSLPLSAFVLDTSGDAWTTGPLLEPQ